MKQKRTINDFIKQLYASYLELGITEVSFYEIENILKIVTLIPEFSSLSKEFNFEDELTLEGFVAACTNYGDLEGNGIIKITLPPEEIDEISSKKEVSEKLSDAIIANATLEQLDSFEGVKVTFDFTSPDSIQQIGFHHNGPDKFENILYTDGEINESDLGYRSIGDIGIYVSNVKIEKSTYAMILSKRDNIPLNLVVRSKYLSDGFIASEVRSVISGITNHYEKVNKEKPKIYKLLRH